MIPPELELTYVVMPAEDVPGDWIGHCLELDVISQGVDPGHALMMVMEAAAIIMSDDRASGRNPWARCAPEEYWPPEALEEWTEKRKELGRLRIVVP